METYTFRYTQFFLMSKPNKFVYIFGAQKVKIRKKKYDNLHLININFAIFYLNKATGYYSGVSFPVTWCPMI